MGCWPRSRCSRTLALVAWLAGFGGSVPAQPPPRFERILWLHGGPTRDAGFWRTVKELGFTAVSVTIGEDPAVPASHELRFYVDQAAGKGILELRDPDWEAAHRSYAEERDPSALARPRCFAEAANQQILRDTLATRLQQTLAHGPLALTLGDEISVTRHASPLDFCSSAECRADLRRRLLARHGDLERLNRNLGTRFATPADIALWTADQIRARELGKRTLPQNLRAWAEHLELEDERLAEVVESLAAQVARAAPGLSCGLTGLQPPSAYGGHDFRRLLPSCTFYEAYDIGGARALAQSLAPPGARQVATLFAPTPPASLDLVKAQVFDLLARGMAAAIVWSADSVFDEAARPSAFGLALAQAWQGLGSAADAAAGATLISSPVWLVESQASVRAHWMLDSAADRASWIRRLSSYEATHSTSLATRASWVQILRDLGYQPRFVPAEQLAGELARATPRLLVLPAILALADTTVGAVRAYVEDGGTVLADFGTAIYDEHLTLRTEGALDAVFGVRGRSPRLEDRLVNEGIPVERGRLPSGAAVAEATIAGDLGEPSAGYVVHIENTFGRGRAVYLNLAVCEYTRVRLAKARLSTALDLRRRVRRVLDEAGVAPVVRVLAEGLPTCIERVALRAADGRDLLAIRVDALAEPDLMRELIGRGPRPIALAFDQPRHVRELVSDTDLGVGSEFRLTLDPASGLLLELRTP